MRTITMLALAGLLIAMPVTAQEPEPDPCPEGETETPEGCSQQAWVDDCPPDMMCAMGAGPNGTVEEPTDDGATYGDCGGEVCAYEQDPDTPVSDTCMDGADESESCDDGVQYLDGGAGQGSAPIQYGDGTNPESQTGIVDGRARDDAGSKGTPPVGMVLAALAIVAGAVVARRLH